MKGINVKKWVVLGGTAIALLLIPRRSSQKADVKRAAGSTVDTDTANSNEGSL